MQIQLRFFARVREQLDLSEETAEVPEQVQTVADVRRWLTQRGPVWAAVLDEQKPIRTALNHQMCEPDARINPGCEVAFFPPVTGG